MEFLRFLIEVFILCVIIRYAPPLLSNFCGEFMAFWYLYGRLGIYEHNYRKKSLQHF